MSTLLIASTVAFAVGLSMVLGITLGYALICGMLRFFGNTRNLETPPSIVLVEAKPSN